MIRMTYDCQERTITVRIGEKVVGVAHDPDEMRALFQKVGKGVRAPTDKVERAMAFLLGGPCPYCPPKSEAPPPSR